MSKRLNEIEKELEELSRKAKREGCTCGAIHTSSPDLHSSWCDGGYSNKDIIYYWDNGEYCYSSDSDIKEGEEGYYTLYVTKNLSHEEIQALVDKELKWTPRR